ncbi:hypothetical protein [Methylobacterium oryzae]|uniref:hypothetical protein n=1 Tax=Methylobacterium oryzae TaxID=334852 RepID=UPI002F35A013
MTERSEVIKYHDCRPTFVSLDSRLSAIILSYMNLTAKFGPNIFHYYFVLARYKQICIQIEEVFLALTIALLANAIERSGGADLSNGSPKPADTSVVGEFQLWNRRFALRRRMHRSGLAFASMTAPAIAVTYAFFPDKPPDRRIKRPPWKASGPYREGTGRTTSIGPDTRLLGRLCKGFTGRGIGPMWA